MTLFRPICLMPLTIRNSAEKIVKVPPLRQKSTKIESKIYKPTKSKFKQKLTSVHRRSAFCIFHPIKVSASVTDANSSAPINLARRKAQNVDADVVVIESDDTNPASESTITCNNNYNNDNRRKRGTKFQQQQQPQQQENVIDDCVASKRTKPSTAAPKRGNLREMKSRQQEKQEKEDFKLAKMLQEYDDNAHSPSSNRTVRYALRSRSKPSSSLSSSSSSIENIQNKFALLSTAKSNKKNGAFTTEFGKTLRSVHNARTATSILSFNDDQKLKRSRRLALAITGA